jgi:hypothetical protein
MRQPGLLAPAVSLLAVLSLAAGSIPAVGQDKWLQDLSEQMLDEYNCEVAYLTNVVEREIDGELTVIVKVHCTDKRAYDAVLDPSDPFFQIRECQLDTC